MRSVTEAQAAIAARGLVAIPDRRKSPSEEAGRGFRGMDRDRFRDPGLLEKEERPQFPFRVGGKAAQAMPGRAPGPDRAGPARIQEHAIVGEDGAVGMEMVPELGRGRFAGAGVTGEKQDAGSVLHPAAVDLEEAILRPPPLEQQLVERKHHGRARAPPFWHGEKKFASGDVPIEEDGFVDRGADSESQKKPAVGLGMSAPDSFRVEQQLPGPRALLPSHRDVDVPAPRSQKRIEAPGPRDPRWPQRANRERRLADAESIDEQRSAQTAGWDGDGDAGRGFRTCN